MKNTTPQANGQGDSALQSLNNDISAVARALFCERAFVDLLPAWNDYLKRWEVSANDSKGNCLAVAGFPTEKEAAGFIDLLMLKATRGQ